jgi:hypothetical protein
MEMKSKKLFNKQEWELLKIGFLSGLLVAKLVVLLVLLVLR